MTTADQQQAQQLQKQQIILQQLNQQFGQQQAVLQNEIQRHSLVLQQQLQQGGQQQQQQQGNQQTTMASLGLGRNNFNLNANAFAAILANNSASLSNPATSTAAASGGANNTSKRSSDSISTNHGQQAANDKSLRKNKKLKASNAGSSTAKSTTDNGTTKTSSANPPVVFAKKPINGSELTPRVIADKCLPLVKKLINHDHGWVFKDPVDPLELGIPEYFDIVEHPMDLTLVVNKLEDGVYTDIASFERDTKLVFENAILFNGEDSDVGAMARELLNMFAQDLKMPR